MRLLGSHVSSRMGPHWGYPFPYYWLLEYIGAEAYVYSSSSTSTSTWPYYGPISPTIVMPVVCNSITYSYTTPCYHPAFPHRAYVMSWTTGTVTVTAAAGPAYTVMARKGFDSRTARGAGEIQMVSPMVTNWIRGDGNGGHESYYTGAVGILKLRVLPEPHEWMMLGAGLSMLGILYRVKRRSR
jgi:hypothetical protein